MQACAFWKLPVVRAAPSASHRQPRALQSALPTVTSRAAGNPTAEIYLVSPRARCNRNLEPSQLQRISCADVAKLAEIHEPDVYPVDDSMIIKPLRRKRQSRLRW